MKKVLSLAAALLLAMTGFSYCAEAVTREYRFTTTDQTYQSLTIEDAGSGVLEDVEQTIQAGGKTYRAASIFFAEEKKEKPVTRTRTYTGLTERQVPQEIKLKSGETLQLADVAWTEHTRQAATGTTTYTGTNTRPDAPATKQITATLPDGSTIQVTGQLQEVKKTGSSYSKPFTVTAKFTGDEDVAYYMLGSTRIPNNPESPTFAGYQDVILEQLGYDSANYRITSGKWTSDYRQENGETVRYAEFTGQQRASDWTAYYTETITADSPQAVTYDAVAEYTNGIEKTSYEVVATVAYEQIESGLTLLQKILLASVAVIVIAGLIAAILLIVRKKRAENEETVTITE